MELRSRTLPERSHCDKGPSDDSETRNEQPSTMVHRASLTIILDEEDFTIPFAMETVSKFYGVSRPVPKGGATGV